MIDVTMTATVRPEIVERTLQSFWRNMFFTMQDQLRMVINIDPSGDSRKTQEDVRDVVIRFFKTATIRMTGRASFPDAVRWIWETAREEYVFNLEDDWELLQPVDLMDMIRIMQDEPDLAVLRLPWRQSGPESNKNWSAFYPWNGKYFECPKELRGGLGFCGHPSLVRGSFLREAFTFIDWNRNPEKQFHKRDGAVMRVVLKYRYGVYGRPNCPAFVRDIGREWMVRNGLRKKGDKAFFTVWETAN